jgi:hypothetical protein
MAFIAGLLGGLLRIARPQRPPFDLGSEWVIEGLGHGEQEIQLSSLVSRAQGAERITKCHRLPWNLIGLLQSVPLRLVHPQRWCLFAEGTYGRRAASAKKAAYRGK